MLKLWKNFPGAIDNYRIEACRKKTLMLIEHEILETKVEPKTVENDNCLLTKRQSSSTINKDVVSILSKKIVKLKSEVREQINGKNPIYRRDKTDPFSTSQKILAQYLPDLLLANIHKHAQNLLDADSLLYLEPGLPIIKFLESASNELIIPTSPVSTASRHFNPGETSSNADLPQSKKKRNPVKDFTNDFSPELTEVSEVKKQSRGEHHRRIPTREHLR